MQVLGEGDGTKASSVDLCERPGACLRVRSPMRSADAGCGGRRAAKGVIVERERASDLVGRCGVQAADQAWSARRSALDLGCGVCCAIRGAEVAWGVGPGVAAHGAER
eukprot:694713-Rhodomonas_salina.1